MPNSTARGFRNVLRFSGRDTRSEFWPYVGAIIGAYVVIWMSVVSVTFFWSGMLHYVFALHAGIVAILVALLAAAVSRRLHDRGLSALWGLLPVPFLLYSSVMMVRIESQFESRMPDKQLMMSVFASNALYLVALIWLIVLLVRRSTPGPNRFG